MSRSKHTDPKMVRAARRVRSPRQGRGTGNLSQRRELGLRRKEIGAATCESRRLRNARLEPRITVVRPRTGFHHPAGKQDVLAMLHSVGPVASYGLRSVELVRLPANASISTPMFGRFCAPGRILLFEQPVPPWRLAGLLTNDVARRLERSGAVMTRYSDIGATLVDWPEDSLRRFMVEEVLLHELGHHVLQHYKGKRPARIARTRDHEAFAARFAEKQRTALMKGSGP